ncbi:MAG: aminoglycoside 3'-phosphotransferase [Defluviitaleaceae bacterium]|nr:aminoglycoside 3'-phosphotransferase [Defluviitaleaceae bacterium]
MGVELKAIAVDAQNYPPELRPVLRNAKVFDSSCSSVAKVIFIEKGQGYFLKTAAKGALEREVLLTKHFCGLGLSTNVLQYISSDADWMLTEKIVGDNCIAPKYLEQPKRLCDTLAELLSKLHTMHFADCPIKNHSQLFFESAETSFLAGAYDKLMGKEIWDDAQPREIFEIAKLGRHMLQNDTLLHGDFCLPNVILDNWRFSGYIDLDTAGVGDRHVDIFWALWTLKFNLKTDKYRQRFIDAYGRGKVDDERLRIVAAFEVFG